MDSVLGPFRSKDSRNNRGICSHLAQKKEENIIGPIGASEQDIQSCASQFHRPGIELRLKFRKIWRKGHEVYFPSILENLEVTVENIDFLMSIIGTCKRWKDSKKRSHMVEESCIWDRINGGNQLKNTSSASFSI
jgi:hypothetical protein